MPDEAEARRLAMAVTGGRMVVTPEEIQPYKVVLEHAHTNDSEHAFATMREGEAFFRSELPVAPARVFNFGLASPWETPLPQVAGPQEPRGSPVEDEP
jgi:hypothetical protein